MSDGDLYADLHHRLHGLTAVQEVVQWLDEVDVLEASGSLTAGNRAALYVEASSALRTFALSVPALVQKAVIQHLLPLSLEPIRDLDDRDVRYFVGRLRENLAKLLDGLPEEHRMEAIDQALDRCAVALTIAQPEPASWMIQQLGQRRADVLERLGWIVAAWDDERGDIALYTLASLGLESADRGWVVAETNMRVKRRFSFALFGALKLLKDPSSMAPIAEGWSNLEAGEVFTSPAAHALNLYGNVAEANPEDEQVQDQAWRLSLEAVERNHDLRASVRLGSSIAPNINSRHVVPDLAAWLSNETLAEDGADRTIYLIGLRLAECIRPRHLESWTAVNSVALTTALEGVARRSTGDSGRWISEPMREKYAAWDLLLRAGTSEPLEWSNDAVGEEVNPFVKLYILERLACFRLPRLPDFVSHWIQESYTQEQHDESGQWASVSGAIDLAHSQMSREAFDALLECGYSIRGHAAEKTASALRGVAQKLARDGDESIAEALWARVDQRYPVYQRSAAAEALVGLAVESLLGPDAAQRLLEAAGDEGREVHERSLFVQALTNLGQAAAPKDALAVIEVWASREDWLGVRSLECLAHWGVLRNNESLLESRLGLRQKGGIWRVESDVRASEWAPHIAGILFLGAPDVFAQAIADWLRIDRWGISNQVLNILNSFRLRSPGERLPMPLIEALIAGARALNTPVRANANVLYALADFAPDALVDPDWAKRWTEWLPEGRAHFADALGSLTGNDIQEERVVPLLLLLGADPVFAVRRAAFRALGRMRNGAMLALHVEALAEFDDSRLRTRAAEAIGWIPTERDDLLELLNNTRNRLATDVDRRVRTSLERALTDRTERRTSTLALGRVQSVRGTDDNTDVLGAWAFGEALTRVGDDYAQRSLSEHLANTELPRHVRFWIRRLLKGIDESWRKRVRERPESWIPWSGEVRTGSGWAHLPSGGTIELSYAVWARPAGSPGEKHTWGGSLRLIKPRGYELIEASEFQIEIEGGARGTVAATRVQGLDVGVIGTGPFPGL